MILATWNVFIIPFEVAFKPSFTKTDTYFYSNAVIDFLFFCDIIVGFRSSYINKKSGEEVYQLKGIAWNYIKTRFTIDVLATVPFDFIISIFTSENVSLLELFAVLKLVRVFRLSRIITFLNFKNDVKIQMKLVKLIFFLVTYLHCFACVWFWIANSDQTWIPPLDYVYLGTTLWEESIGE